MRLILITILLVLHISSYSQEYGNGHELVEIPEFDIKFYGEKILEKSLPNKIETLEDVLRHNSFRQDTLFLRKIYTDISKSFMNDFQYYIENPSDDLTRTATSIKISFKIDFLLDGEYLTFVQYSYFKDETFIKTEFLPLIKIGKNWKICGHTKLKSLPTRPDFIKVLSRIKPHLLYLLINGEVSREPLINNVISKTRYKNGFDGNQFYLLVKKWRKEKDKEKLDYFFFPNL